MLPTLLTHSPILGLVVTLVAYRLGEILVERFRLTYMPPLFISIVLIMLTINYTNLFTYKDYEIGGSIINFLLGPATIALSLPLFRQWKTLKENSIIVLAGVLISTITGIVTIICCAKLFGASDEIIASLVPKSVTTPIAMDISATIGGLPSLTVACVILTGILGATIGHKVLALAGVKNNIAIGLAIGSSSHALGTSSCIPISAVQVAFGSLAIALVGIATAILAPIIFPLLK